MYDVCTWNRFYASTPAADEAPTPTNILYALHVKCASTKLRFFINFTYVCSHAHRHTQKLTHSHNSTRATLRGSELNANTTFS